MFDSLLGSNLKSIGSGRFKEKGKGKAKPLGDADELKIESRRQRKLRDYDKFLKTFKYGYSETAGIAVRISRHMCYHVQ